MAGIDWRAAVGDKDSDDEMPTNNDQPRHLEDAQGLDEDDIEGDVTSSPHPTCGKDGNDGNDGTHSRHNGRKKDVEDTDGDWDITRPNVRPPHTEWPINTKELEVLMPKQHCWVFAKQVFNDPEMWEIKSWTQEKFTISKTTHPEIKQHWKERHMTFQPHVYAERKKVSSIYWAFLRLLIAEFLLKWKVDYSYEDVRGNKLELKVHPSVAAIQLVHSIAKANEALKVKENKAKDSKPKPVNKGKRKVDEMERVEVAKTEGADATSGFFAKTISTPVTKPSKNEVRNAGRKSISSVETTSMKHNKEIRTEDKKENMSMTDVCKNFGNELGRIIDKDLCPKYGVVLCSSSVIDEYKSKLQAAQLKGKESEKTDVTSSTTDMTIMRLKSQIFDRDDQIAALTSQSANLQRQLVHRNKVIEDLKQEKLSNEAIIKDLTDGRQSEGSLDSGAKIEEGTTSHAGNFVTMKFIDPLQDNDLYPDDMVDNAAFDKFFHEFKDDKKLAGFVRERGSKCIWCRNPWGPESVVMLGTCGHIWHHSCLLAWMSKNPNCWCRRPLHKREYAQRGLLDKIPPPDTQANWDSMPEHDTELTQAYSVPIENFTANPDNLDAGNFDDLLYAGRVDEWQQYCIAQKPSLAEADLERSIRRHRRHQRATELAKL